MFFGVSCVLEAKAGKWLMEEFARCREDITGGWISLLMMFLSSPATLLEPKLCFYLSTTLFTHHIRICHEKASY